MSNCTECGAPDNLCQTRFDEFLVLEFTDAGYGAVHHLTVAAYMVQHSSKMTREGWLFERNLLREFLIENKPSAYIRKQNKNVVDSGKCTFKIKSNYGKISFCRPRLFRRSHQYPIARATAKPSQRKLNVFDEYGSTLSPTGKKVNHATAK